MSVSCRNSSWVRPMSQRTLSVAPYGDRFGMDPSSGGSRSTGPQMASGDPSFKNTKNLFIHIALIPIGDIPRVHPNILKCLHHSPVAKGYRLVVIASRAMVCKTPTYYLIIYPFASARGCVILRSHILFFLLLILLISHHIQP